MRRRRFLTIWLAGITWPALVGCQASQVQVHAAPPHPDVTVYLTVGGWHTGIILPVRRLNGSWRVLLQDFPGADYLLFGWGERNYYMTKEPTAGDALQALFPGPAVLLVTPLDRPPPDALIGGRAFALGVTTWGFDRLANFIWAAFDKSAKGKPRRIGSGFSAGSVFYAASGTYSADYTCNTWTAEGLRVGGLPVTADGVVFAYQVVEQVQSLRGIANSSQTGTGTTLPW